MAHFKNVTNEFKKRLAEQPVIKRAVVTPMAQEATTFYSGSDANPNLNGPQVFAAPKRRKHEGE